MNIENICKEFWYDFDNYFSFNRSPRVLVDLLIVRRDFNLTSKFMFCIKNGTIENDFREQLHSDTKVLSAIERLANDQIHIINRFFKGNKESEQIAFELFGQGILFDNISKQYDNTKKKNLKRIHMMDEGILGYITWYGFIVAAHILEIKPLEKWLQMARNIMLAAQIHNHQNPLSGFLTDEPPTPINKKISRQILKSFRLSVKNKDFCELNYLLLKLVHENNL